MTDSLWLVMAFLGGVAAGLIVVGLAILYQIKQSVEGK